MKKHLQARLQQINHSKAAKVAAFGAGSLVALPSFAVTTFTTLPTSAATAVDGLLGLGADVGIILFSIGTPILLAVIGWNMFRGGAKKASRM